MTRDKCFEIKFVDNEQTFYFYADDFNDAKKIQNHFNNLFGYIKSKIEKVEGLFFKYKISFKEENYCLHFNAHSMDVAIENCSVLFFGDFNLHIKNDELTTDDESVINFTLITLEKHIML